MWYIVHLLGSYYVYFVPFVQILKFKGFHYHCEFVVAIVG